MASPLDQWIRTLSKGTLAALVIGIGILFIIFSDPPRTVCDSQLDAVKKQQASFLFPDQMDKKDPKGTSFKALYTYCKNSPGPGACYELFAKLRLLVRDLNSVPNECTSSLAGESAIQMALWMPIKLMVESAWGTKPPEGLVEKLCWLDSSDIGLFCNLSSWIVRIYGQPAWEGYRESLFKDLPGAASLGRKEAWERMLLSVDCPKYM